MIERAWRLRALWIGLLLLVAVTALFRPLSPIIDLVTLEPIPELSLEPIDPLLRTLTEPVSGPLMALLGLPMERVLAWAVWACVAFLLLRVGRRHWRGRRAAGLRHELFVFAGWYVPLAVLPRLLFLPGWISKTTMKQLSPLGLPATVFLIASLVVVWRAAPGQRLRSWLSYSGRFVGAFGVVVLLLILVLYSHPLQRLGSRLVAPDRWIPADFHAHSDTTRDSILGAPGRLAFFDRHGIRISAVTEHRHHTKKPKRLFHDVHTEILGQEGYDMLLLRGREITTHILHLILLGTDKPYDRAEYRLPDLPSGDFVYDWKYIIDDAHADGGRVIVAHWWTSWTYYRVDWRKLIEYGVDGFEIGWAGHQAPPDLVEAWRDAGMLLVATNDYHGYRKMLYCWTLLDADVFNPDRRPFRELDPAVTTELLFARPDAVRPVAMATYNAAVPFWLEPPFGAWHYLCSLSVAGRASWIVLIVILWLGLEHLPGKRGAPPRTNQ